MANQGTAVRGRPAFLAISTRELKLRIGILDFTLQAQDRGTGILKSARVIAGMRERLQCYRRELAIRDARRDRIEAARQRDSQASTTASTRYPETALAVAWRHAA